jgi:hypothetical protein
LNKIIPIIGFGVGLICLGLYWHLFNDVFLMTISPYVLHTYTAFGVSYTHDKYFDFMYMIWRLLPWICIIVGVILLIAAGVSSSGSGDQETST